MVARASWSNDLGWLKIPQQYRRHSTQGLQPWVGRGVGVCTARRGSLAGYWKHIHCLRYNRMFTVPVLNTEMLSPLELASSLIVAWGSSKQKATHRTKYKIFHISSLYLSAPLEQTVVQNIWEHTQCLTIILINNIWTGSKKVSLKLSGTSLSQSDISIYYKTVWKK